MFKRWATKKSAGSTKNGRDSKPKNLGVKKFGGEVKGFCFRLRQNENKGKFGRLMPAKFFLLLN